EEMESAASRTKTGEHMTPERFDSPDYGIIDKAHIAVTQENGRKLDRIHEDHGQKLDLLTSEVKRVGDHLQLLLPAGSRKYLEEPNVFEFEKIRIELPQRVWHLLRVILNASHASVSIGDVSRAISGDDYLSPHTISNYVSL